MVRLTQPQLGLLMRAAQADGGLLDDGGEDAAVRSSLIRRSLMLAIPHGEGRRLMITEQGRKVVAERSGKRSVVVARPPPPPPPPPQPVIEPPPAGAEPSPGGKLGVLVELLSRGEGATLGQMQAATGWQAHSVRGALAGALKRRLKLTIASEKLGHGRVYRIASAEAA